MMQMRWIAIFAAMLVTAWAVAAQQAEQSHSCCKGQKQGHRGGMMMDEDHQSDMEGFRFLLDNREKIDRSVKELPNGVETLTESRDPGVVKVLREHVRAMYRRLEEARPIHRRDPLFEEIFRHADAIEMTIEETEHGLLVRETSSDEYVAKLIKSHAQVVSAFIENGYSEMRKNHALPSRE